MERNNLFAQKLDQLVKSQDALDLPQDVYDYIKSKIIADVEYRCEHYMSELSKKVSRGEYKYANGKRVVNQTFRLWTNDIEIINDISNKTHFVVKYFSNPLNANALRANHIHIVPDSDGSYTDYTVSLFNCNHTYQIKESFFGFKAISNFDIQKAPFADVYVNAMKSTLKKNGISCKITVQFIHVMRDFSKLISEEHEITVKKCDITDDIPLHICESFETPRVNAKHKLDRFTNRMFIETTVSF